jgi:hypothetical protein
MTGTTPIRRFRANKFPQQMDSARQICGTILSGRDMFIPNESLKFTLYYEIVRNEKSALPGFETDASDNVLTCRVQYNF